MQDLAKFVIAAGVLIVLAGVALLFVGKVPFLGRLPGDISFSSGGFTCFFPLATMILLSLILTIVLNVIIRLTK